MTGAGGKTGNLPGPRGGVPSSDRLLANRIAAGNCAQPGRIRRDAIGTARSPRAVRHRGAQGSTPPAHARRKPETSGKFGNLTSRSAPVDASSNRRESATAARRFDLGDDCGDRLGSRLESTPRRWRPPPATGTFESKGRPLKELDETLIVPLPLALGSAGEPRAGAAVPRGGRTPAPLRRPRRHRDRKSSAGTARSGDRHRTR